MQSVKIMHLNKENQLMKFAMLLLLLCQQAMGQSLLLSRPDSSGQKELQFNDPLKANYNQQTIGIRWLCAKRITNPLFMIDGVVADMKQVHDLDAQKVESIRILNSANGTSIS